MKKEDKKRLLLVRSGYPAKEFVLKKLKELGYFLIVLDSSKTCPDELVDEWIISDLKDEEATVAKVVDYIKNPKKRIDGVITFWEEVTLLVSKISEELNLVGIPFQSAVMMKNKYQFREFCHKNNLPSPKDALLQSEKDIPEIAKKLTFPVVVKPIYGACSAFVIRVEDQNGLEKAYMDINKYISSFGLLLNGKM